MRSASVVGMVGAGGIGVILWESIRGFYYAETCAAMIILVITVSAIDLVSARIRRSFIPVLRERPMVLTLDTIAALYQARRSILDPKGGHVHFETVA